MKKKAERKHVVSLDHTPASVQVDKGDLKEWFDFVLMAAEELGRERGYFTKADPYQETYDRKLTERQQMIRDALRVV
jgi:hypothetical protein